MYIRFESQQDTSRVSLTLCGQTAGSDGGGKVGGTHDEISLRKCDSFQDSNKTDSSHLNYMREKSSETNTHLLEGKLAIAVCSVGAGVLLHVRVLVIVDADTTVAQSCSQVLHDACLARTADTGETEKMTSVATKRLKKMSEKMVANRINRWDDRDTHSPPKTLGLGMRFAQSSRCLVTCQNQAPPLPPPPLQHGSATKSNTTYHQGCV